MKFALIYMFLVATGCALFLQIQFWFDTCQIFYSESDFAVCCWKLCTSYTRDSIILEYDFLRYSCLSHRDLLRTDLLMIVHHLIYFSTFQSSWVVSVKSCNWSTVCPNKGQSRRCCIVYFSLQLQVSGPVKYPWWPLTYLMTLDLATLFWHLPSDPNYRKLHCLINVYVIICNVS